MRSKTNLFPTNRREKRRFAGNGLTGSWTPFSLLIFFTNQTSWLGSRIGFETVELDLTRSLIAHSFRFSHRLNSWFSLMLARFSLAICFTFAAVSVPCVSALDVEASGKPASDSSLEPTTGEEAAVPDAPITTDADQPPVDELITPEQDAAIKAFVDAREKWGQTLLEMRSVSIRFSNNEDRSPAAKKQYGEIRDSARAQMNDTFLKAVDLFRLRKGDFETGSMLATTLEYRESFSLYEDSLEAAELLLETEMTFPFLYKIAARSAFLSGKYDKVLGFYTSFVELNGVEKLDRIDNLIAGSLESYPALWTRELEIRAAEAKADDLPRVLLQTSRGPVTLELFENQAPNTVANFIKLIEDGFYDGADFYQVIDDFIAMGGDPVGDGSGTSGRFIPDENNHPDARGFFRGAIGMAVMPDPSDKQKHIPNTGSSQFAIALMPIVRADESKTIFGRVIEGMDVVATFRRIDPTEKKEKSVQLPPDRIETAKVIRKRDHEYKVEYSK